MLKRLLLTKGLQIIRFNFQQDKKHHFTTIYFLLRDLAAARDDYLSSTNVSPWKTWQSAASCICLEITHMIWDNVKLWCKTQSSGLFLLLLGMESMTDRGIRWPWWNKPKPLPADSMSHFEQHRKISTLCNLSSCHTYIHLAKTLETAFDLQISPFTNCCF